MSLVLRVDFHMRITFFDCMIFPLFYFFDYEMRINF